ncbi:hypothetical protein ACFU44_00420 [Nocardia rhizosphaerihabitans]|uniref:hypothetical protein n=1 Tax=Nocardia rhizosphaerihabitans TaxID=1691570 RepID=UPI00366C6E46
MSRQSLLALVKRWKGVVLSSLTSAAESGGHLEILKALRATLVARMDEASAGVMPQYAKQIADLSREIAENEPQEDEKNDIDEFSEAFSEPVEPEPKAKRGRK